MASANRDVLGLSPAWQALADRLPTRRLSIGLSKAMSYFSRKQVDPSQVDAAQLETFRVALATTSLDSANIASDNTLARLWNEAVATIDGWPKVELATAPDPRRYSLAWSAFPKSFTAEVEAFLAHGGNQNVFARDYASSVRPSTLEGRRQQIRNIASALVLSGFAAERLTGLAVLIEPANAEAALRHLKGRAGGKHTPQHENMARLLAVIARHWVKARDHDEALRIVASALHKDITKGKARGMTPKNRGRLRQFDLEGNRHVFLGLGPRVLAEVRRHDSGGKGEAVRVMMALAVHLLTRAPMRIKNFVELEVERHLPIMRRGGEVNRYIIIPEEETKNGVPFEMMLPAETNALLTAYLDTYRPRIAQPPGRYLFPGRGGALRPTDSMAGLLKKFIKRETGLVMNPHLFRHLAVKLYVQVNPHDIETPRRFLGHTTTRTTIRAYSDLQGEAAHRRYDDTISQLTKAAAAPKRSASRRKDYR
jgi:hypothetical protein